MQGQKSSVQSLLEKFELDHGSSSSNSGLDQAVYWNNMVCPGEAQNLPNFLVSSNDANAAYTATIGQSAGGMTSWNLGGPSSSDQSGHQLTETKVEHGGSDAFTSSGGPSVRLGERQLEPTNFLSFESVNINLDSTQAAGGSWLSQSSSSSDTFRNTDLNTGFVGAVETHPYRVGNPEVEIAHAMSSIDPCLPASGTTGDGLADAGDSRPGSTIDGRRFSCKRKALEGVAGQSSLGASSSFFQGANNSPWHPVPARHNPRSSLSIANEPSGQFSASPPEELLSQQFGGTARAVGAPGHHSLAENSQRNYRMRVNPVQQQDSSVPGGSLWTAGGNVNPRRSHVWSSHQSTRVAPNHLVESRLASTVTASTSSSPAPPLLFPQLNPYSFHVASSSRAGSSSNGPVTLGERPAGFREEPSVRNIPRNISEHQMFVTATDVGHVVAANSVAPGNAASSSRIGSSAGRMQPSSSSWIAHNCPPPYNPRRMSEMVRRSLFSSSSLSGVQSSSFSASGLAGSTSQELVLPSGPHHGGSQHPFLRSALWMDRHDGVIGVPLSLRSLAAVPEGRSRLASEIRSVLDLVRRGENIRFEDVLILDQSVFYGVADLHDRHRDMRLDVDNMSYEELLALEERIGNVSTGLSEETVMKRLKQRIHVRAAAGASLEVEPCCICQEEYVEGEQLGTLDCGHDFHTACIKQWLLLKNLCPICKTTALAT